MTLKELRNELDRTRPAWEAVDLDGLYGLRKRNLEGNLILQRHRPGPCTQRCVP